MNKIISSSGLSLCIGAALLLASCNDQEVKVNSVNVNVTEALSPERSDSVRVNVNAEYPVACRWSCGQCKELYLRDYRGGHFRL